MKLLIIATCLVAAFAQRNPNPCEGVVSPPPNIFRNDYASCESYFWCDGENAVAADPCEDSYYFDEAAQVCDSTAECQQCPAEGSIAVAIVSDNECLTYNWCVDGVRDDESRFVTCPTGTRFNRASGVCDLAANVRCPGHTPAPETTPSPSARCRDEEDNQIHGNIAYSASCSAFQFCNNGVLLDEVFTCVSGLHFNPSIGNCDLPENLDEPLIFVLITLLALSGASLAQRNPNPCDAAAPGDFVQDYTSCSDYFWCDSEGQPISTGPCPVDRPIFEEGTQNCVSGAACDVCPTGADLPIAVGVEGDTTCTQFQWCRVDPAEVDPLAPVLIGVRDDPDTFETCPSSLRFNRGLGVCDRPENVNCPSAGPPGAAPCPPAPESGNVEMPPGCDTFIACNAGVADPTVRTCPSGLHFNPLTGNCDLPENRDPPCDESAPVVTFGVIPKAPNASNAPKHASQSVVWKILKIFQTKRRKMMKFLITVLALICLTIKTLAQSENPCDVLPPPGDGLVNDPSSCPAYFSCVRFTPFSLECPSPFYFDPTRGVCDFPSEVDCNNCPASGILAVADPDSCRRWSLCVNGVVLPQECAPGTYFDPDAGKCNLAENVACTSASSCSSLDGGTGLVPDIRDCNSFHYCFEGSQISQGRCHPDLAFDQLQNRCVLRNEVNCYPGASL
ncbi:CLUMA_CG011048, isoform A [Clunio marinus]|uniref:CLUMA_CG011048, isoform A n=1 Tax=Clunio marinus TaxID=568069 RepID=A0A1J1IBK7_9DIPT|nr:CLUMA_CG011048, isoform A [Clunio marinus]